MGSYERFEKLKSIKPRLQRIGGRMPQTQQTYETMIARIRSLGQLLEKLAPETCYERPTYRALDPDQTESGRGLRSLLAGNPQVFETYLNTAQCEVNV